MSIKFANEIIKEIEKRGPANVPRGNVTGEEFENWLMNDYYMGSMMTQMIDQIIIDNTDNNNTFIGNYGEAA